MHCAVPVFAVLFPLTTLAMATFATSALTTTARAQPIPDEQISPRTPPAHARTSLPPAIQAALAAARVQAEERVLQGVAQDLERGQPARAERRLRAGLERMPDATRLLARFAELAVPIAAEAPQRPSDAQAQELLDRLARRAALPGDPSVLPDLEIERLLVLHAALAEAVLERYADSFTRVALAGRLQDRATVSCLRQIAALAVTRDQLALAEQALAMARQYFLQDVILNAELGHVLLARGRGDAAMALFAERFAIDPGQLAARCDLAYALTTQGRAGEALALLSAERLACENDLRCALVAARVALEAGRPAEAVAYAAHRLARDAENLDALFVTADAHTRAGDLEQARATYQRVLQVRPDSPRAQQALAQLPASNAAAR